MKKAQLRFCRSKLRYVIRNGKILPCSSAINCTKHLDSKCRIQFNKSLLFEIVFIAGWIPRSNYTFVEIKRINAEYRSSSHLCVGVRECVVRESACMACKRSPVRSRYSPPDLRHCTEMCGVFFVLRRCVGLVRQIISGGIPAGSSGSAP